MGIVKNQSFRNLAITYFGFGIGAINVLFLYIYFLPNNYHGLISYILSTAAILMPILALGTHNTIIKFYSSFNTNTDTNSFLSIMLFLPILAIIVTGSIGSVFYNFIATSLSQENPIIKDYVWLIYVLAICFAYFEVFYAWAKTQLKSVFGNFMKEVFHRLCILLLFAAIYLKWIHINTFIYCVSVIYVLRTFIMMCYAFSLKRPVLRFKKIPEFNKIIKYSLLIIVAGSVASIILEIDKFMIGEFIVIDNIAFYNVAIFIAAVVGVPARAMHQITNPITAVLLNKKDFVGLKKLYKQSSLTLFVVSGLVFLLIVLNINQLYLILPEAYRGGILIIFLIGITKLIDNVIGNINAILFNSNYYRVILIFGVILALLAVVLNMVFIPTYGIYGAAFATFIAIVVYNISKISFVYKKFKMLPFTTNTLKVSVILLSFVCLFYFWEFSFRPMINIGLKSVLVSLSYTVLVYRLGISKDINTILDAYLKKNT